MTTNISSPRYGLARVLSKLGVCSRTQAGALVREGRVAVNGRIRTDPEHPTHMDRDRIAVDGREVMAATRVYIALNKPRGIVVTTSDERDRETVYGLLAEARLPWLAPVGRLDKASEGLLLMTNDSAWAAHITAPQTHLPKTYHVQVDGHPDDTVLAAMREGVNDAGEHLAVVDVQRLRRGEKNEWLSIVLDEGRNRHIRRLIAALDFEVLRLVRVAIGAIHLGQLGKGQWRTLEPNEVASVFRNTIRT